MSKRVEIEIGKQETPAQKDERRAARIDLNGICKSLGLRWFSYKECFNCRKVETDCACSKEKADLRVVYFIHERGLTTGVKFVRKTDMAETAVQFHAARSTWSDIDLVIWAGRRGLRILTTMSPEKRAEIQAAKAALEAMKEASASGSFANVEAGVAPVSEVVS